MLYASLQCLYLNVYCNNCTDILLETARQRARLLSKLEGVALLVLRIFQTRWREGRERDRERQDRARVTSCREDMAGAGRGQGQAIEEVLVRAGAEL